MIRKIVDDKVKVLFVTNMWPSSSRPTCGIFVKKIVDDFSSFGIETKVIDLNYTTTRWLMPLHYFWFYLRSFFCSSFSDYDLIYVHYSSHSSLGVILSQFIRTNNVVTHLHGSDVMGDFGRYKTIFHLINQLIFDRSRLIICPSEYFREQVLSKYQLDKARVSISPSGGFDSSVCYMDKKRVRTNRDCLTLGFAGSLIKGKGCHVLLKAMKILIEKNVNVKLHIVGDGVDKVNLQEFVETNHMTHIVTFSGFIERNKLGAFYRSIDYFVFPTMLPESLGLVGIESLACGTPVVGSRIGAIPSYVVDGETGFLFEAGNTSELVKIIKILVDLDEVSVNKMKRNCLSKANPYDSENVLKELVAKFTTLIKK